MFDSNGNCNASTEYISIYKVHFEDGEIYHGGNLNKSLWNQIPKKPIKRLEYNLFSKPIILEGYDSYNHLIEKINIGGKEFISKVFLMGRRGNCWSEVYKLDLNDKSILFYNTDINKEYEGNKCNGWKEGK